LLVTLAIAVIYFIFSTFSTGFYQHDEVAHFLNMQRFWYDPSAILGTWAKPGFKIAYVIPAYFGAKAVLITNILFASFTAFFAGKIAEHFKIPFRVLVMVATAFVPMFYQIAFRNYSEVITGLVLSILMLSYVKEKYFWAALSASYLFTLRQEMALIGMILGLIFLLRKKYIYILVLATAPVLLNVFGWLSTGNPNFLLDQLTGGGVDNYRQMGFFHLWTMFTPSVGVISTALFLVGFLSFLNPISQFKAHLKTYHILYISFLPVFLFWCVITEPSFNIFKLSANLRQLVSLAPVAGVFVGLGFQNLSLKPKQNIAYVILAIYGLILFNSLSYEYNHVFFTDVKDYTKPAIFVIGIVGSILLLRSGKISPKILSFIVSALIIGHTIQQEKPYELNNEEVAVLDAAEFAKSKGLDKRNLQISHTMFNYFLELSPEDRYKKVVGGRQTVEEMSTLPKGTIVVWDSHYSYRSQSKNRKGTPLDFFQKNSNFRALYQKKSSDQRFFIAILEKLN
ncbi:MAG: hypothetical protein ACPG4W_08405, partial [Flavobacteriales bacterium]